MPFSHLRHKLLVFVLVPFKRCFNDLELSTLLVKRVRCALQLSLPGFKLIAELRFKLFLNTHPEDVSVDGQDHFLSHRVKVTLLPFDSLRHLLESLLKLVLDRFTISDLLQQPFLVVAALVLGRAKLVLNVSEELVQLFFLAGCRLECLLHREESSLEVILLLEQSLGG